MPAKFEYTAPDAVKKCVECGNFFFRRRPCGSLDTMVRWQKRIACGGACAQRAKWKQRRISQGISEGAHASA
jgi:hypothetical protein